MRIFLMILGGNEKWNIKRQVFSFKFTFFTLTIIYFPHSDKNIHINITSEWENYFLNGGVGEGSDFISKYLCSKPVSQINIESF